MVFEGATAEPHPQQWHVAKISANDNRILGTVSIKILELKYSWPVQRRGSHPYVWSQGGGWRSQSVIKHSIKPLKCKSPNLLPISWYTVWAANRQAPNTCGWKRPLMYKGMGWRAISTYDLHALSCSLVRQTLLHSFFFRVTSGFSPICFLRQGIQAWKKCFSFKLWVERRAGSVKTLCANILLRSLLQMDIVCQYLCVWEEPACRAAVE